MKRWLTLAAAALACGPAPASRAPRDIDDRIAIVAVERGPQGTRLVAIDEHGDRRFELVQPPADGDGLTFVRDDQPAVSPDGRWVVFASTRGRSAGETSLWIAPLGPNEQPVRLTAAAAIDAHPAWTASGAALVFASTREGGDYDLWQLPIARGRAVGEPTQLTQGPDHEVTPAVARDGTIVYAAVRPLGPSAIESRLVARAPNGRERELTAGPSDTTPALSPDGRTLAFARPRAREGGAFDLEIWTLPTDGATATALVDLPLTDETGPVWSRDGRVLFATSLYRGEDRRPIFSSIVHVDLRERERRARMLLDRAGPIVRLAPAIVAPALDATALRRDPEYLSELARIMTAAITNAKRKQGEGTP